jgi:hypothetical protein
MLNWSLKGVWRAVKTGPGYRHFVTRLSYAGARGTAEVLAYDNRAIKTMQVEW